MSLSILSMECVNVLSIYKKKSDIGKNVKFVSHVFKHFKPVFCLPWKKQTLFFLSDSIKLNLFARNNWHMDRESFNITNGFVNKKKKGSFQIKKKKDVDTERKI